MSHYIELVSIVQEIRRVALQLEDSEDQQALGIAAKAVERVAQKSKPEPKVWTLPNGRIRGSEEDKKHWWTCHQSWCAFTGPHVGTDKLGRKACLGSCGGITRNPET